MDTLQPVGEVAVSSSGTTTTIPLLSIKPLDFGVIKEPTPKEQADKALKWMIRSGALQTLIGSFASWLIGYINHDIAMIVFTTNLITAISQIIINYLDYLKNGT